jgi:hypothetical protein
MKNAGSTTLNLREVQPSDPQQFTYEIIAFHFCKKFIKIIKAVQLCLEEKFRSVFGGSSDAPNATVHLGHAQIFI